MLRNLLTLLFILPSVLFIRDPIIIGDGDNPFLDVDNSSIPIDIDNYSFGYKDKIDYIIASVVVRTIPINIEFAASSSINANLRMDIALCDTDRNYLSNITSIQESNTKLLKAGVEFTLNDTSFYNHNRLSGPIFLMRFYKNDVLKDTIYVETNEIGIIDRYFEAFHNLDEWYIEYSSDKNIYIYRQGYGVTYESETFRYYNYLLPYVDLDADNRFIIDQQIIMMTKSVIKGKEPPVENTGFAMLLDANDYQPNLDKVLGAIRFPGNYVVRDNVVYFESVPTYYVDSHTRLLYMTKQDNTIISKDFFIPVNADTNNQGMLNMQYYGHFGYSKAIFSVKIDINPSSRPLVGNCYTSDYCVSDINDVSEL